MLPADRHVHTEWSWDAPAGSMERTCERALELGLRSVAFTDHADFTRWSHPPGQPRLAAAMTLSPTGSGYDPPPLDIDGYLDCLQRCRERFSDLTILWGVELSEPHWNPGPAASLLRRAGFDLVVMGLHSLRLGPGSFAEIDHGYRTRRPASVLREYLAEAAGMIGAWDDFDVLAHIDYAIRDWPGQRECYRPEDFEEEYRAVLSALAGSGRTLEINTRLPLHPRIVEWWRQEGGTSVSFGSDAHDPLALARGFCDAAAVAEAQGFRPGRHRHDFWAKSSRAT